jgi:orotidine-5'-phosphate decarboxylase
LNGLGFADRMHAAQTARGSTLAIALAPSLDRIPYPLQQYDDPFLPYGRAVIDATADIACAYIFDLAAYLAVGASGAIALERTIAAVPTPTLTIVHGPLSRAEYARLLSPSSFGADAATLDTADPTVMAAFMREPEKGAFTPARAQPGEYANRLGTYLANQWLAFPGDSSRRWRWAGDEVALASRGADFQDAIRAVALKYRNLLP